MVKMMVGYVEANPNIFLKEITEKLREEAGISRSTNTVHRHLHGQLFSVHDEESSATAGSDK